LKTLTSFLFLILSILFTCESYTQREDWLTIYDENNKSAGPVDISIKESSIQLYPLKEIALYLYTPMSFNDDGNKVNAFVMSRIRFRSYLDTYSIMSTYKYENKNGKVELVQVDNSKFIKGWRKLFINKTINSRIWEFARKKLND